MGYMSLGWEVMALSFHGWEMERGYTSVGDDGTISGVMGGGLIGLHLAWQIMVTGYSRSWSMDIAEPVLSIEASSL
jgi:hypothetical protein